MKDISHLYDGQFDCQKCYKVTWSFAITLAGLSSWRRRVISWL
jgi:hypothetical protein